MEPCPKRSAALPLPAYKAIAFFHPPDGGILDPLLYGSLGLEKRLSADLNADDIDVLIPEIYIKSEWNKLINIMNAAGYRLVNEHEHEFCNGNITVAYAALESLTSFAGIDISTIPMIEDKGKSFLLLELSDYLKVYEASSKDGYRKNVKNKQDKTKLSLIRKALEDNRSLGR